MRSEISLSFGIALAGIFVGVLVSACTGKLSVKRFAKIILVGVLLVPISFILLPLGFLVVDGYALGHLEANARNVVTGDELQAWATKVLAHPGDYSLRTNYPSALRRVHPLREPSTSICTNLDNPPFVTLEWNEVDIEIGFEIGPTNFVGRGQKWQDGVYFVFSH